MSATVIPLLTYDKLYPLGDLPERRERSYGSRTPPLYSLSRVNHRPSVHTGREEEEEEEADFISVVNTNEDPPNAHQAQHRPVQATGAMSA